MMYNPTPLVIGMTAAGVAIALLAHPAVAGTQTASAGGKIKVKTAGEEGEAGAAGSFSLGENFAIVDYDKHTKLKKTWDYKAQAGKNAISWKAKAGSGANKAEAVSTMKVAAAKTNDAGQVFYPYDLEVEAEAKASDGHAAKAQAIGQDPQPVTAAAPFEFGLDFGAGFSMFSTPGDGGGHAEAAFLLEVFGPAIDGPLLSISLSSADGVLTHDVAFADDPRLTFRDPVSFAPIDAAELAGAIVGADGLTSPDGLTGALELVTVTLDLTGLTPDDSWWFSSDVVSTASAAAIPTPGAVVLGVVGLGAAARRRRV